MTGTDKETRLISRKCRAAVFAALFVFVGATLITIFAGTAFRPPKWAQWNDKEERVTVNGAEVQISLKDRSVSVFSTLPGYDDLLWKSNKEWLVSDLLIGDIDRDGDQEVLLLLWKRGSFGLHRPFWLEKDTRRFTQHIFIYDLSLANGLKPVWMSSSLEIPVLDWQLDEKNLIHIFDTENNVSVWGWMSWGLSRVDE